MHEARHFLVALQHVFRDAELALLIVEGGVVAGRLADEELRAVVEENLVEMVRPDHHKDVGLGAGKGLAIGFDLALPLRRLRHLLLGRHGGRLEIERVMC